MEEKKFLGLSKKMHDPIWEKIEREYCSKCELYGRIQTPEEFYECAKCAMKLYLSEVFKTYKSSLEYIR